MPHKHTRKGAIDKSTTDLPPTLLAHPLPVSKSASANGIFTTSNTRRPNKKRKRNDLADDTPKAFARLMAFQAGKKLPKGLDDGVQLSKKQRKAASAASNPKSNEQQAEEKEKDEPKQQTLTIKPGERMAEFSARVDAALPVSGLIDKGLGKAGKDPLGLKVGRTFKEKKMHKMYAEWRAEEARIQDRRAAALEDKEMEELEEGEDGRVVWKDDSTTTKNGKKKKKGGKKKVVGEVDDGETDPWASIQRERGGRAAFGDVVQAPPTLPKLKEKFKVRGAGVEVGDVPRASGSLRRREELGEVRRVVVEGYRALMRDHKAKAEAGET